MNRICSIEVNGVVFVPEGAREIDRLRLDLRIAWEERWIAEATLMRQEAHSYFIRCGYLAEDYREEEKRVEAAGMSERGGVLYVALCVEVREATERVRKMRALRHASEGSQKG